jgi:hypothetical protein
MASTTRRLTTTSSTMASLTKEQVKGGAGARAEGAAYAGPNKEAKATIGRTAAEEATDGEIGKDDNAGKGGHGLRHGMAGLEAAMAVPGSTAARFAECAQANRAPAEETATKHKAVCHSIVDDQAGALGAALGPKATEQMAPMTHPRHQPFDPDPLDGLG